MSLIGSLCLASRALAEYHARRAGPRLLARRQDRRLRPLLRHAAERSPFYRDKFRGLDLDRCGLTDLPVTTKPELVDHFDAVVTDPRVRHDDVRRFTEDQANGERLYLGRY